jgi:TRAP-type C4-dicarboxylate transport system permease large subunit
MILLVLLGADMLNTTLALTQMPAALATWVQGLGMPPLMIIFIVILIYLFLGCVMESMSMIMLTVPMFYPMIMGLDIMGMSQADKSIWFGIICLTVVEVGLIHPPVGMNVYLINRLAGDVPLMETFRGVVPFLISDGLRTVLLVTVPSLSLFLVHRFS